MRTELNMADNCGRLERIIQRTGKLRIRNMQTDMKNNRLEHSLNIFTTWQTEQPGKRREASDCGVDE